jgi:DNA-binding NarL/FixJ family response regulator
VLRQDEPAALAPQPQLADLPALVEAAREAGVEVELSLSPALDRVPAGVGVCAYRIVQESLSNASQHAPGAAVTVSVGHSGGAVSLQEGFAASLAAQPALAVVGLAADGADAVRLAQHLRPDVVLMDVRMPVMDGLEAARQILAAPGNAERPRVLMLTTFDLDDYVYEAIRAGASGFLLKDATAAELVHAVRVVAAGDALLAPSVTRRLIARGLSNTEISGALVIAEQTTKTHVGRILAKLDLRDRAQAVVLAYETGLVTPGG